MSKDVDNPNTSDQEVKSTPQLALDQIREHLERVALDYAEGKLNSAQFNAMYSHYIEKRDLIERLVERNPESDVWRNVATSGKTTMLRQRFESRPIYYCTFARQNKSPLISAGKLSQRAAKQIHQILQVLWRMRTWRTGVARKSMGDGLWMLLNIGEKSLTIAIFLMQPSDLQVNLVRDLHHDFEAANHISLDRGEPADRMVFPQRALIKT